ncbi:MAG: hypothetical protein GC164_08845 [Phycisphaera sp.]|nr:hypothetical protein [Phycisphaera sp.]
MTHARFKALVVLLAVLMLAGYVTAQGRTAGRGRPTAVAVCDVQRAFDAMEEKKHVEADLQTRAQKLQQEKQDREKEITQLQSDLDMLAPDTPAYDQKQADLERRAIEYRAWLEFQTNKLNRDRATSIESLYRKLLDSIGTVAKDNGYDMVVFKETAVNFKGAKPEQLSALIQVRKVLWASDDLDITDLAITQVNNAFNTKH